MPGDLPSHEPRSPHGGDGSLDSTLRLVEAAQAGEREALEALFERYLPRVRRIVALRAGYRLRQLEDVDDLVQDALLRVFRDLDRFEARSEGSFRSWIARCVEREVIDGARRANAEKRGGARVRRFGDASDSLLAESIFAGDSPTPSAVLRGRELEERLEEALLALPDHHREVIVLRKICEMSYAEIARTLGFAEEVNARMAVSRALKRLRELLGE